jgi:hypothetical protein
MQPIVEAAVRMKGGRFIRDTSLDGIRVIARIFSVNGTNIVGLPSRNTLISQKREVSAIMLRGRAEFSGMYINGSQAHYVIQFSMKGRDAIYSDSVEVQNGIGIHVALVVPAGGSVAGFPFAQQPVLTLVDDAKNTLMVESCLAQATSLSVDNRLLGTTNVSCQSGLATFSDLQMNVAAADVPLQFTIVINGTALRARNDITVRVGAPATIRLSNCPQTVSAGQLLDPAITAEVLDFVGNLVYNLENHYIGVDQALRGSAAFKYPHGAVSSTCKLCENPLQHATVSATQGLDILLVQARHAVNVSNLANGMKIKVWDTSIGCIANKTDRLCQGVTVTVKLLSFLENQIHVTLTNEWKHRTSNTLALAALLYGLVAPVVHGRATFNKLSFARAGTSHVDFFLLPASTVPSLPGLYDFHPSSYRKHACTGNITLCRGAIIQPYGPIHIRQGPAEALIVQSPPAECYDDNQRCNVQPVVALVDLMDNVVHNNAPANISVVVYSGACTLTGSTSAQLRWGRAKFVSMGLHATKNSTRCELEFRGHVEQLGFLRVVTSVQVAYSALWHLHSFAPSAMDPSPFSGQRFGHSVTTSGPFVVAGAPFDTVATRTDVFIEVSALKVEEPRQTVQVVDITAEWRPEIHTVQFICSWLPNSTCHGSFILRQGLLTTRELPFDVSAAYLETVINEDLLSAAGGYFDSTQPAFALVSTGMQDWYSLSANGSVLGTREFVVEFQNIYGAIALVESLVNTTAVNETASSASRRVQSATIITGGFSLMLPLARCSEGSNAYLPSRSMDIGISARDLQAALSDDWGVWPLAVTDDGNMEEIKFGVYMNQRRFQIAFPEDTVLRFPLIEGNSSGLDAPGVAIMVMMRQEGSQRLGGSFALRFGSSLSPPINVHDSGNVLAAALQATTSEYIIEASVIDKSFSHEREGFAWKVSFLKLPKFTSLVHPLNLPDLAAVYSAPVFCSQQLQDAVLSGQDVAISVVSSLNGSSLTDSTFSTTMAPQVGETGAAYIFYSPPSGIMQAVQRLVPPQNHDFARFGAAVSVTTGDSLTLHHSFLAVSAPSAPFEDRSLRYHLHCAATDGYFVLSFDKVHKVSVRWNATVQQLKDSIVSLPNSGHAIVESEAVLPLYVCDGSNISIFSVGSFDESPLLSLIDYDTSLAGKVSLLLMDSASPHLLLESEFKPGAVFLYSWDIDSSMWSYTTRTYPDVEGSQFGHSISLSSRGTSDRTLSLAVGAPAHVLQSEHNAGQVYVFNWLQSTNGHLTELPPQTQRLNPAVDLQQSFLEWQFGWSVAISGEGDTLAVGAPGAKGCGAVLVYKRQQIANSLFFLDQVLDNTFQPNGAGAFGYHLALAEKVLVVGAPDAMSFAVQPPQHTGAAYVYQRADWGTDGGYLNFVAELTPSVLSEGDRFGAVVATSDQIVAVATHRPTLHSQYSTKETLELSRDEDIGIERMIAISVEWPSSLHAEFCEVLFSVDGEDAAAIECSIPAEVIVEKVRAVLENAEVFAYERAGTITVTLLLLESLVAAGTADVMKYSFKHQTEYYSEELIPRVLLPKSGESSGNVFLYNLVSSGNRHAAQAIVVPHEHQFEDGFGSALSISSDSSMLIVGAPTRGVIPSCGNRSVSSGSIVIADLLILQIFPNTSFQSRFGNYSAVAIQEAPGAAVEVVYACRPTSGGVCNKNSLNEYPNHSARRG